jgi:hypothetical protein
MGMLLQVQGEESQNRGVHTLCSSFGYATQAH